MQNKFDSLVKNKDKTQIIDIKQKENRITYYNERSTASDKTLNKLKEPQSLGKRKSSRFKHQCKLFWMYLWDFGV